jgi:capsular exopolysaccharide synthesis family protein
MSRIFDALQRSEGDRKGTESIALPQGQELLREAERRVAADWEAAVSVEGKKFETIAEVDEILPPCIISSPTAGEPFPLASARLGGDEWSAMIDRFQSSPISVSPESRLVCLEEWTTPTAEAIRLLALRLRDIRRSRALKKVVITSTVPREGKSTIAVNLSCALARKAEEKVLLIEGDVRLPVVLKMFGIDRQFGLCEFLRGKCDLTDCVCHLPDAGIWVLPAGKSAGNPLEFLQSQNLPVIMNQLSAMFDWVLIDSPPVLPLADTSIWMRLADGVLLVTRQGVTEKKQLQKGLEFLEPQKLVGAVLNSAQASHYSSYYYAESERT